MSELDLMGGGSIFQKERCKANPRFTHFKVKELVYEWKLTALNLLRLVEVEKNVIASAFSNAEKDKLLCDCANPSRGDDQLCLIVRQTFLM